jgi:adenosylcobinamide-phosphate synthase
MDLAANLTLTTLAVAFEACVGYPQGVFRAIDHPVIWIGRLIALADRCLNHEDRSFPMRRALGFFALLLLLAITGGGAYVLSLGLAALNLPRASGFALTALIASSLIAQCSLMRMSFASPTPSRRSGARRGRWQKSLAAT